MLLVCGGMVRGGRVQAEAGKRAPLLRTQMNITLAFLEIFFTDFLSFSLLSGTMVLARKTLHHPSIHPTFYFLPHPYAQMFLHPNAQIFNRSLFIVNIITTIAFIVPITPKIIVAAAFIFYENKTGNNGIFCSVLIEPCEIYWIILVYQVCGRNFWAKITIKVK